jgi:hypothetical protein
MKFPKHRANCYVVVRYLGDNTTVCGVFPTYDGADAYKGDVVMTTYYDA